MISKRLEEISEADLDHLLANSVSEGKTIEYKRALPDNSDGDKKEFLADVSSFANTTGGDLIFGVNEERGLPTAIPGLAFPDSDHEVRRLDSIINDGLEPRVRYTIRVVQREANVPVLIVRTERSWIGPHRVVFKGHDKFYARNSAGKYPMDVSELRSAFTLASSTTDRVRQFRADRIAKVRNNRTPVTMSDGASKTILHSVPLESFSRTVEYDVLKYNRPAQRLNFPPLLETSYSNRINLDGVVAYGVLENSSRSYTQLFRDGSVEAVENYWLNSGGDRRIVPQAAFEREIVEYLKLVFKIQIDLGVNPPMLVALSLTGTTGLAMAQDSFSYNRGNKIREEDLILPEVIVDDLSKPPSNVLKPLFDLVWNACGYPRSENFDEQGNWIGG
jgi:hypothetical protein